MLVDTHAHIQFNAYKEDAPEVIKRAKDAGVFIIAPSSQINTSRRAVEFANKYDNVWAAVGLHPIHLEDIDYDSEELGGQPGFKSRKEEFDYEFYKELGQTPEAIAIGEIGLDKAEWLNLTDEDFELQKQVFEKQIDLALELDKPIIIHCRGAHEDVLKILEARKRDVEARLRGVAHCFSGRWLQAQRYFDLGFLISFTGNITYCRDFDKVIRNAPLEKIMVETDCPYMAPEPIRSKPFDPAQGKRNEPAYVKYVAGKIAEIKEVSFEDVAEQTTKNAIELFGLNI